VKAGDNLRVLQTRRVLQDSFLCPTSDWILEADIPELPQMVFPAMRGFILRPDIILYSTSLHRVVIYEHTCPNEQRILTSSVLKRAKYSKFCLTLAQSGWDVHMHTGEASALGFVSSGVRKFLLDIGISKHNCKLCIHALEDASRLCSHFIWLARNQNSFVEMPISLLVPGNA